MAYAAERCLPVLILILFNSPSSASANDILGCGGFVKSHVKLDYSEIEIGLYTKEGSLKEKTECAPTNGYYFLPVYEKGDYVVRVHPPAGLSFEPSQVAVSVDGVSDPCATGQDINFSFNGFGINGRVVTLGQKDGPSGVAVQLVSEKGETRNTVTTPGGDFHFSAVIPGKYTVKASHPRWKLDPTEAVVEMKEGKMSSSLGVVLAVKGYEVQGSVSSFGSPIQGLYVLLYSKEDNPKYRVEGCNTALLQGVDAPICHVSTDASGEFTFGLVPAGEYRLAVAPVTPGKPDVTYNVKPASLPFTVRHDSLYIKNAFEVTGFNLVGSVLSTAGEGLSGARVLVDGVPAGTTDAGGRYTLPGLKPGTYTVSFQHEKCEIEDIQVAVDSNGPRASPARVSRWRVCGEVRPRAAAVALRPDRAGAEPTVVTLPDSGEWCTFLAPGVYIASVEVSDQHKTEGLQYYPVTQKVSVGHGPVDGVKFSQLRGTVSGTVECGTRCGTVRVTLRYLAPDGGYSGEPRETSVEDGKFTFTDVVPGSVEVGVQSRALCWPEPRRVLAVSQPRTQLQPFRDPGYLLHLRCQHPLQIEFNSSSGSGEWSVPAGASSQCVRADTYTLTPRGCHRLQPERAVLTVPADTPPSVEFVSVAHAAGVTISSPEPADDLTLSVHGAHGSRTTDPLQYTQDGAHYIYRHTLYLAEGEVVSVWASSQSLLFTPGAPVQLVGGADCAPSAASFRARRALTLAGRIIPPVEGVTVTLMSDDTVVAQQTSSDGRYKFGPVEAARAYRVLCERESYVFSEADAAGDVRAARLAEIHVQLVDDADGSPLQGALVSVSGGAYRRSALQTAGALRFTSLSPAEYYVKPNMKEYKFTPPHKLLAVTEGNTHTVTMRGVRVAWSCTGRLVSLGGAGWAGAVLAAVPVSSAPHCATEEATTEANGAFRIRGLVPGCEYQLTLKESAAPELAGLRLARKPDLVKIVDARDVTGLTLLGVVRAGSTDVHVLVRAPHDQYGSLRLSLQAPLYSARVQAVGYTRRVNPGVVYALPRLPADNKTYVLTLESSLSRATHEYAEDTFTFVADGRFKHVTIQFAPKLKSSEQELRQSSFLIIPLLGLLAFLYSARERLLALAPRRAPARPARPAPRPDILDKASIHNILSAVNATGKKPPKPKKI